MWVAETVVLTSADLRFQICEGGDLEAYLNERYTRKESIPENTIWKLFSQLVRALHYCHDPSSRNDGSTKYIIHGDLKPANSKLLLESSA